MVSDRCPTNHYLSSCLWLTSHRSFHPPVATPLPTASPSHPCHHRHSSGLGKWLWWADMEVPTESFHRSSWDSRTCYPWRATNLTWGSQWLVGETKVAGEGIMRAPCGCWWQWAHRPTSLLLAPTTNRIIHTGTFPPHRPLAREPQDARPMPNGGWWVGRWQ